MKFLKAFNNSAALVEDDGTEKIVLGKGIGFGLKKGQDVDQSKIERCFVTTEQSDEVEQVKEFTAQTIDVTNQIVKLVEPLLQAKFSDYQYLALADHNFKKVIALINRKLNVKSLKVKRHLWHIT